MFDSQTIAWIIVIAALVVYVIYKVIQGQANRKKIEDGEDKARLRETVVKVLPEAADYPVLYAYYEETTYVNRRRSITHYYYYAVTFHEDRFWVIPLKCQKNEIEAGEPNMFTKDVLGDLFVSVSKSKDRVSSLRFHMKDKEGKNPSAIFVDAVNYRSDSYHPVNIAQQPECDTFCDFISVLANQVKGENQALQQQMEADVEKRSRLLGILGIVFCFIPLIDLIFGGFGLLIAPKPSATGGKPKAGFILSLTALILNLLVTAAEVILIANM